MIEEINNDNQVELKLDSNITSDEILFDDFDISDEEEVTSQIQNSIEIDDNLDNTDPDKVYESYKYVMNKLAKYHEINKIIYSILSTNSKDKFSSIVKSEINSINSIRTDTVYEEIAQVMDWIRLLKSGEEIEYTDILNDIQIMSGNLKIQLLSLLDKVEDKVITYENNKDLITNIESVISIYIRDYKFNQNVFKNRLTVFNTQVDKKVEMFNNKLDNITNRLSKNDFIYGIQSINIIKTDRLTNSYVEVVATKGKKLNQLADDADYPEVIKVNIKYDSFQRMKLYKIVNQKLLGILSSNLNIKEDDRYILKPLILNYNKILMVLPEKEYYTEFEDKCKEKLSTIQPAGNKELFTIGLDNSLSFLSTIISETVREDKRVINNRLTYEEIEKEVNKKKQAVKINSNFKFNFSNTDQSTDQTTVQTTDQTINSLYVQNNKSKNNKNNTEKTSTVNEDIRNDDNTRPRLVVDEDKIGLIENITNPIPKILLDEMSNYCNVNITSVKKEELQKIFTDNKVNIIKNTLRKVINIFNNIVSISISDIEYKLDNKRVRYTVDKSNPLNLLAKYYVIPDLTDVQLENSIEQVELLYNKLLPYIGADKVLKINSEVINKIELDDFFGEANTINKKVSYDLYEDPIYGILSRIKNVTCINEKEDNMELTKIHKKEGITNYEIFIEQCIAKVIIDKLEKEKIIISKIPISNIYDIVKVIKETLFLEKSNLVFADVNAEKFDDVKKYYDKAENIRDKIKSELIEFGYNDLDNYKEIIKNAIYNGNRLDKTIVEDIFTNDKNGAITYSILNNNMVECILYCAYKKDKLSNVIKLVNMKDMEFTISTTNNIRYNLSMLLNKSNNTSEYLQSLSEKYVNMLLPDVSILQGMDKISKLERKIKVSKNVNIGQYTEGNISKAYVNALSPKDVVSEKERLFTFIEGVVRCNATSESEYNMVLNGLANTINIQLNKNIEENMNSEFKNITLNSDISKEEILAKYKNILSDIFLYSIINPFIPQGKISELSEKLIEEKKLIIESYGEVITNKGYKFNEKKRAENIYTTALMTGKVELLDKVDLNMLSFNTLTTNNSRYRIQPEWCKEELITKYSEEFPTLFKFADVTNPIEINNLSYFEIIFAIEEVVSDIKYKMPKPIVEYIEKNYQEIYANLEGMEMLKETKFNIKILEERTM